MEDITPEDQFVLLACDGLFDVFTNEEVVSFVKSFMEKTGDSLKCCHVCQLISFLFVFLLMLSDPGSGGGGH
jgi:serine/threonine protein phosphatase PrpC